MNIIQAIEDIKLFCDPFTEIHQKPIAGKKRLLITRNGKELAFDIDVSTGRISAKHRSIEFKNLRSLLASSDFADIRRFAETQQRFFKRAKETPIIELEINYSGNTISAENLVDNMEAVDGKVNLVLLDGPAGVGKTFQITQLAKAQSLKFLSDNVSPPILHVSSSGRRLSNFKDVLAATTQEMGASFGGIHVPMLVRHGLLIAAIDGFDELVDADGYEDSWRALREFVEDVGGAGKIILAARDTFLDEQELIARISNNQKRDIALNLAHIQLASADTAIKYLSDSRSPANELTNEITEDIFSHNSYALRPFFLTVLKEAGGWRKVHTEGFRAFLVNNLIDREAKILSRTLGSISGEAAVPALYALFEEVALEMAARENNRIENEHLAFLTDYCFGDLLDDAARRKITHKAGSISFLELSDAKDKRQFPHTEIQFYFLGKSLIGQLEKRIVPSVLRRSILGAEHLEVFAEVIMANEQSAKRAINYLNVVLNGDNSNDRLAANGGAMVLLSFGFGLIDRVDYLMVNDATFVGGSPSGTLQDVDVSRLDVCGCNLSKVIFDKVKIGILVVDEFTQFGSSRPTIGALEIRGNDSRIERDPGAIDSFIENHLITFDKDKLRDHPAVQLLGKIARRSMRYCYLRDGGDDDEGTFMLRDASWAVVKKTLTSHGRLEVKKGKQMHGRPAALIRIKRPIDLLNFSLRETLDIMEELLENDT